MSSDLVARLGGEEFAVHAVDIEPAGLAAIANGLIARVRASEIEFAGNRIRYTVSIGGALDHASMSIDRLLSLADVQLYEVSTRGETASCSPTRAARPICLASPRGQRAPHPPPSRLAPVSAPASCRCMAAASGRNMLCVRHVFRWSPYSGR